MADEEVLTLYSTTISSSLEIKKQQQRIRDVLESKKFPFKDVDISVSPELKAEMREVLGDPTCLPPQLCKGKTYIGNFQAFENAVEEETLEEFLKLK